MEESGFFPAVLNSAKLPDSRAIRKAWKICTKERKEEEEEGKKTPPTMRFGSDLGFKIKKKKG